MTPHLKDPDATLDYAVDWTAWLEDGDSIAASEWIVTGLTGTRQALVGATATIWLSGGEPWQTYLVTNRVTTAAGRIDDRTLRIRVIDR